MKPINFLFLFTVVVMCARVMCAENLDSAQKTANISFRIEKCDNAEYCHFVYAIGFDKNNKAIYSQRIGVDKKSTIKLANDVQYLRFTAFGGCDGGNSLFSDKATTIVASQKDYLIDLSLRPTHKFSIKVLDQNGVALNNHYIKIFENIKGVNNSGDDNFIEVFQERTDENGVITFWDGGKKEYKCQTYVKGGPQGASPMSSPIFILDPNNTSYSWQLEPIKTMKVKVSLMDKNGESQGSDLSVIMVGGDKFKGLLAIDGKNGSFEIDQNAIHKYLNYSDKFIFNLNDDNYILLRGRECDYRTSSHEIVAEFSGKKSIDDFASIKVREYKTKRVLKSNLLYCDAGNENKDVIFPHSFDRIDHMIKVSGKEMRFLVHSNGHKIKLIDKAKLKKGAMVFDGIEESDKIDIVINNMKDFKKINAYIGYPMLYQLPLEPFKINEDGHCRVSVDRIYKPVTIFFTDGYLNYFDIAKNPQNLQEPISINLLTAISVNAKISEKLMQLMKKNGVGILSFLPTQFKGFSVGYVEVANDRFQINLVPGKYQLLANNKKSEGILLPQTIEVKADMKEIVLDQLPEDATPRPLPELFFGKGFTPFDIADKQADKQPAR